MRLARLRALTQEIVKLVIVYVIVEMRLARLRALTLVCVNINLDKCRSESH